MSLKAAREHLLAVARADLGAEFDVGDVVARVKPNGYVVVDLEIYTYARDDGRALDESF